MNYFEWSQEYIETAKGIEDTINRLKNQRKLTNLSEKKELETKISRYRDVFYECMQTARLLEMRAKGVM